MAGGGGGYVNAASAPGRVAGCVTLTSMSTTLSWHNPMRGVGDFHRLDGLGAAALLDPPQKIT